MKYAYVLSLILSGCSSLQFAGNATYKLTPFVTETGTTICCAVEVRDGKERASLDLHVVKNGDNYDITMSERGVLAFSGQTIAAGATQAAIDAAAKAAVAASMAPLLPALIPVAGAALASPGIGAAAVGAGAMIVKDKVQP